MAKINEILKDLIKKAGVTVTPELTATLESEALNVDLEDGVSSALQSNLISFSAAKEHPEIGQVYKAQTLNQVDTRLQAVLEVLDLSEEEKTNFLSEKNTYKKLDNLNELIKKAKAGKAGATGADKAEHAKALADLQKELRDTKQQMELEKQQFQDVRKKDLKNFALKGKIKSLKTILDSTNEQTKFATCSNVIDSLLNEYKAELVTDEQGELVLQTKDGQKVYNSKTNTPINADEFLELALSQNKLLSVTNPPDKGGEGDVTPPIKTQGSPNATTDKTAKAVSDFNAQMIAALNGN